MKILNLNINDFELLLLVTFVVSEIKIINIV